MAFLKIQTNIPVDVEFQFNQPKEYTGQYGTSYNYGVTHKGENMTLSATKILHEKLQSIGNLRGKSLQILKYEDGQRKLWKILDPQGNEINTGYAPQPLQSPTNHVMPQNSTQTPLSQNPSPQVNLEALDGRIKAGFAKRDEEIAKLKEQLEYFAFLFKQNNPDAYEVHKDKLPEAKEPPIPIIEEKSWADEATEELFKEK